MAITNAQQYKQILQKVREEKAFGGVMGLDGRRAYVGGSFSDKGGYQGQGDGKGGKAGGEGTGIDGQGGTGGDNGGGTTNQFEINNPKKLENEYKAIQRENKRIATEKEKEKLKEIKEKEEKEAKEKKRENENLKTQAKKKKFSFKNFLNDIQRKRFIDSLSTLERKELEMQGFDFNNLSSNLIGNKNISSLDALNAFGYKSGKYGPQFDDDGNNIFINTGGGGGDGGNNNTTPIIPKSPIEETQEEVVNPRDYTGIGSRFLGSQFDFTGLADGGIARAGYMDGGRMKQIEMMEDEDDPVGGIMDLESARDMYFVGGLVKSIKKGVKKATKAVKKIAKSPIGKAALLGAIGFGIPGTSLGGIFGRASFGGAAPGMFGFGGIKNAALLGKTKLFGQFGGTSRMTPGLFGKLGLTSGGGAMLPTLKGGLALGLGVPAALDMLGLGKDDDDQMNLDEYYKTQGIDIRAIRNSPYRYLAPRFTGSKYEFADGGRIGYQEGGDAEPVAKKTMPLLDMDGMEKDYREDGGFVPIGRMERADDVPARLSKNEFVFTADAVRNAGEGDIDKGAEVMYNMMKNLESGGEVSEESQGLDGAKEMFKTSQRLEEVL